MAGSVRSQLRVMKGGAEAGPASGSRPSDPSVTPDLDDSEILEACRLGDISAAGALHARVRPVVDATIARLLGRKDSRSEDLAQIAMTELVLSLGRFRGECSLDTWTRRVTAHTVYKELRRRKVEHRVFAPTQSDDPSIHGNNPLDALEARDALRRVREHLDAIDGAKAWTLVLHDIGGYDLKEIAEITSTSVAAAQSRLVRGRADLQKRIEADPELSDLLLRGRR
jgi:RNA polymerase sigma-70 factor (ECF subfamily)